MADAITVSAPVSGTDKTLELTTGVLAPQSQGAVVARIGNTQALVTANGASFTREGIDFFPLTVDVEEKMYAVGKIPGSFFRREGRPADQAVLTCRLIDRPLRPSFGAGYRNETQVVSTILGADQVNPHDVISITGASAALMLSGLPFDGPLGAVRLAYSTDGEWIPHPTYQEIDESTFQLVVAGRSVGDGDDVAIMMVEGNGTEKAWSYYSAGAPKVTEAVIAEGLERCKVWIGEAIALQRELVAEAGVRPALDFEAQLDYDDTVLEAVSAYRDDVLTANTVKDKAERNDATTGLRDRILGDLDADGAPLAGRGKEIRNAIRAVTKKVIRERLVNEGVRMDGRGPRDLRPVTAQVGVIPTAHGTGLFQRGETQVLNVLTLGMPRMDQMLDTLGIETKKRYMHHYNMPPYSNGETGRIGGTKRREVGHGMLAERALLPVVPSLLEWPYALRLVSEVLSSNGSTSMGSVCSSSLSLMDGGVPIKAPVAGIAMGLIKEGDQFITLTDILGAEDAFGDMDFKIAGTEDFITALQLDTKIDGLPADVLAGALDQAREARLAILEVMNATIPAARADVGETAPKMISFEIPIDKIGEVIGPKGKVINAIQAETGADISVDDDGTVGTVAIGSSDRGAVAEAERQIKLILDPPTADVGAVYTGRVVNITKFGAFVNILPGRDGLVHISKLGGGKRIDRVEDVVSLGDELEVRVDDVDPNGKVSLTPADQPVEEAKPKSDRGDRGDRGGRDGGGRDGGRDRDRGPRRESSSSSASSDAAPVAEVVSFEDSFDAEVAAEFGDLGPAGDDRRGGSGPPGGGDRDGGRRRRRR
ncbi:polyribonucleotide nucleotidyltransferase [Iamia sp.]|uniref:polyribonucleotide nucleotidyltransferase n=1 Tax=Iamia sp. TaxID=2722710 RepID=UPI002C7631CF|nr:polyribonucleotide nucleotidyltransferase [Iamia sp.]HXH56910.1 polyribonucleotide nucleotidyltransferase [Iamia sp.]